MSITHDPTDTVDLDFGWHRVPNTEHWQPFWERYPDTVAYDGGSDEGPTCGICDGIGHGYAGAGPCPLEELGWGEGPGHAWELGS